MPNTNASTPFDADVIIVGAGPIGLIAACALRHHGVSVRLLEERPEPSKDSKANNLWARPQELLAGIGARDAIAQNSYQVTRINVVLDKVPLEQDNQVKTQGTPTPYPNVLYTGQNVIEKTLIQVLEARGGKVERRMKVVEIAQDDEGVDVTVVASSEGDEEGTGQAQRLRCRYLIGADGIEGTVRKALGLDFERQRLPDRANRSMDAKLEWRRSTKPDQIWFFVYHNGFAGILPVWGGYHRLFFLEDEEIVPDRDPTLEEMQARAREVTGDPTVTLSDPIWTTYSRFQHGVSKEYSKGRVFLAGDAGHENLPIGGQGMNSGIHDAVTVAWRLAMALRGHVAPVMLESYGEERHGVHESLDGQQTKGFRQLEYRNRVEDAALDLLGRTLPNLGTKIFGGDDLQQLSVSYPKSPLSEDHLGGLREALHKNVVHPGDRAPDAEVVDRKGEAVTLFSHLYNPDGQTYGWCLLLFDGRRTDAGTDLLRAAEAAAPWSWVRPRLVLAAPPLPEVEASAVAPLFDLDGQAHSAFSLEGVPALVLVRPDGHIAFRGPADRPDLLAAYCERVFGKASGA